MIDAQLLNTIVERVAKEKLLAEIHQWIIYTGPPEVIRIYKEYLEESQSHEIEIKEDNET